MMIPGNYGDRGGQVYYDPVKQQYYTQNSQYVMGRYLTGDRTYLGDALGGSEGVFGKNIEARPPTPIPSYIPAGLPIYGSTPVTPAARPTPAPQPAAYPQFDMSFIQQAIQNRLAGTGQPRSYQPTLTPGARQTYGGQSGIGGLAALRGIAMGNTGGQK
jgi:hypothetical protein